MSFLGDTSYPTGGSAFLEPFRTAKDATPTIIALVPISTAATCLRTTPPPGS
ncbi:MAG: hypothetical protein IPG04_14650 [Polyangiaceae bacterium]|nr:hypothetical protein [Polyangiaceae bacterium]